MCTCAPSLLVARDELNAAFPGRSKASDGCCASSQHHQQNPSSDHEPNAEGFARAFDFDEKIGPGRGDQPLLPLKAHLLKDPRTKYVIYERRIAYPDGTDRPYSGPNAHDKHLHLSIRPSAVHDTRPWHIAAAFAEEDDGMAQWTEEQLRNISKQAVREVLAEDVKVTESGVTIQGGAALGEALAVARRTFNVAMKTIAEQRQQDDPTAFAEEVASHLEGVSTEQVEQALRNVLVDGVGH